MRRAAAGLGALIVGAVLLVAIIAPYIAPHDPFVQDLNLRMVPPEWMDGGSSVHPLGTDQLGRDYLSRLMYGARISMTIGIFTVITSGLIGITLGVLGGYFGGRVDDGVMFVITCRLSIPLILVALTVVALIGSSLLVVILTLGLLLWERFAVVSRTTTMQVRNLDYIAAAQASGASRAHILLREVLPNILTPLIVVATLEMALAILLEAALSFLGLGCAAAAAVLGADDRRRQGLHVLLALGDHGSRHGAVRAGAGDQSAGGWLARHSACRAAVVKIKKRKGSHGVHRGQPRATEKIFICFARSAFGLASSVALSGPQCTPCEPLLSASTTA